MSSLGYIRLWRFKVPGDANVTPNHPVRWDYSMSQGPTQLSESCHGLESPVPSVFLHSDSHWTEQLTIMGLLILQHHLLRGAYGFRSLFLSTYEDCALQWCFLNMIHDVPKLCDSALRDGLWAPWKKLIGYLMKFLSNRKKNQVQSHYNLDCAIKTKQNRIKQFKLLAQPRSPSRQW